MAAASPGNRKEDQAAPRRRCHLRSITPEPRRWLRKPKCDGLNQVLNSSASALTCAAKCSSTALHRSSLLLYKCTVFSPYAFRYFRRVLCCDKKKWKQVKRAIVSMQRPDGFVILGIPRGCLLGTTERRTVEVDSGATSAVAVLFAQPSATGFVVARLFEAGRWSQQQDAGVVPNFSTDRLSLEEENETHCLFLVNTPRLSFVSARVIATQ